MSLPEDTYQPTAPQQFTTLALGPMIIGYCLQLILYGISTCYFGHYYVSPAWQRDSLAIKLILCTVVLLNTFQSALYMADTFHFVTLQKRDAKTIMTATWIDCFIPVAEGLIAVLVQSLLARRAIMMVFRKALKFILAAILGLTILTSWIGTIIMSIGFFIYFYTNTELAQGIACRVAFSMFLIGAAVTDCLISVTLWVTLRSHVHGFRKRTDNVLKRVIKQAWRTAALTAIAAVIASAIFLAFGPTSNYSTLGGPFWYPLPALYALSLFTVLASRQSFNDELSSAGCTDSEYWADVTTTVRLGSPSKSKWNTMMESESKDSEQVVAINVERAKKEAV